MGQQPQEKLPGTRTSLETDVRETRTEQRGGHEWTDLVMGFNMQVKHGNGLVGRREFPLCLSASQSNIPLIQPGVCTAVPKGGKWGRSVRVLQGERR
jgi:hypothetical protein